MRVDLAFDKQYVLTPSQMRENNFKFSGYSNSKISHNDTSGTWTIEMVTGSKEYAITNGTLPPYGSRTYFLDGSSNNQILLNMHSCDDNTEFNCKDGSCVAIDKRCDSNLDCHDGSDEIGCNIISIPPSYLSHVPAKSVDGGKSQVTMNVDMWSILGIHEVEEKFKVKFSITMTWKDTRVTFLNLKEDSDQNTVALNEARRIWLPILVFENTESMVMVLSDVSDNSFRIASVQFACSCSMTTNHQ